MERLALRDFKIIAKLIKRKDNIPHNAALERLARILQFQSYHEAQIVLGRKPYDEFEKRVRAGREKLESYSWSGFEPADAPQDSN